MMCNPCCLLPSFCGLCGTLHGRSDIRRPCCPSVLGGAPSAKITETAFEGAEVNSDRGGDLFNAQIGSPQQKPCPIHSNCGQEHLGCHPGLRTNETAKVK